MEDTVLVLVVGGKGLNFDEHLDTVEMLAVDDNDWTFGPLFPTST